MLTLAKAGETFRFKRKNLSEKISVHKMIIVKTRSDPSDKSIDSVSNKVINIFGNICIFLCTNHGFELAMQ